MTSRARSGSPSALPIVLCLLGSGYCALAYQVTWMRELRLVFGTSTAATAAVLAVFMAGVGLGSFVLGKRADNVERPLRLYAHLEWGIAVMASITPLLLIIVRQVYVGIGGTPLLGWAAGTLVRLVLSGLVLMVPTFLMGGTLPAAVRALAPERDRERRRVALAYGANAVGAVAGVIVPTFFLFELLGQRLTLWSACALNLAVALAALWITRAPSPARAEEPATRRNLAARRGEARTNSPLPDPPTAEPWVVGTRLVLAAAAVSGFTFFLMELVWYRMLAPLLGGSTFTFSLILAMALAGIAIGSLVWSSLGRAGRVTFAHFGLVCALQSFFVALPFALGDRLVLLALGLRPLGFIGFAATVATWCVIAMIVVLPAAILAGAQFPMLIALIGRGRTAIGCHTGIAYGWNTAGAIAGSLAGGFLLLPTLGAPDAWRLVAILLAALAAVALVASARLEQLRAGLLVPAAVVVAAIALLPSTGPTAAWRHNPVAGGRYVTALSSANAYREILQERRRTLLWEADGVESSVGVTRENGLAFLVNGKSDGNARLDSPTQVMLGMLPALVHPDPRRSLVVGLGTGSTAGWLGAIPGMEQVEVLELEPVVARVARECGAVNHDALDNPKVRIHYGDAREILLAGRSTYDLIASEPSNPYRAGIASLFTVEFYRAAASRLAPGGLLAQWVQAYEIDGASIGSIYATLLQVFAEVETWQTQDGDLLFLAAREPIRYDLTEMQSRIRQQPYREALARIWRVADLEGVFARYVANADLARAIVAAGAPFNTDDQNRLEFALARSLGRHTGFSVGVLHDLAAERGFDHPPGVDGALDGTRLHDRRASAAVLDEEVPEVPDSVEHLGFRTAAKRAFAAGDYETAFRLWSRQPQEPSDFLEWLLVARGAAEAGDQGTLVAAAQLEEVSHGEANAIRAEFFARTGRIGQAIESLERALAAWRADPWPHRSSVGLAFSLGHSLASDPRLAPWAERLYELLDLPFVIHIFDGQRLAARFRLAEQLFEVTGSPEPIRDALAAVEPHVPWERNILSLRAASYAQLGDSRAATARRDLEAYVRAAARPLVIRDPSGVDWRAVHRGNVRASFPKLVSHRESP